MTPAARVILHLSLADGVGPVTIQQICSAFLHEQLSDIYTMVPKELRSRIGVSERMAQCIAAALQDIKLLEDELERIVHHNITLSTCVDDNYPTILRTTDAPPPVLYVMGTIPLLTRALACVGSRNPTEYGYRVVTTLIPELIGQNIITISGGAMGIDMAAHRATLKHGGNTIAVLGSGLLHIYPTELLRIREQIIGTGGALISPFPLSMRPVPRNFPARNRIIAALSSTTLVIQAAQRSGALITAAYALEYGRNVCAIPGQIDEAMSAGCNELIKQGAHCITHPQDILSLYGIAQNSEYALSTMSDEASPHRPKDPLIAACKIPCALEDLVALCNIPHVEIMSRLCELQLAGKIAQDFTGKWKSLHG